MRGRPLTPQARLAQAARTRNQARVSASQEPPRREAEPEKRKEAVEVEDDDDDDEEEEDERLRREEDQKAEQRARKKGTRGEVEPVVRDGPPKRKKYAVRLEEGFDVEKVIDRLLEGHNDLVTLKEILASAPRLREELKGRLSRRLVPNVHLGTILRKGAEWSESGTKMDWKCVACGTVDLMVKGSKCAAMVDTGAEINIIREADAIRFGLDIDRFDCGILHGAICKAVFCGTASNVLVEVGKVKARACFFIMPDVDHGILLGRGRLKQGSQRRYKTVDKKCRPVPVLVTEDEEAYYEKERGLIRRMRESVLAGSCRINEGNEKELIIGESDFLLPQERTLMVELMKRKHRAYAFSDEERGRMDVDKIPMIRIHTVPHEPWNMRGTRYPNPDEEKKVVDYLDGKIRTHVADYSSGPYASPWFCFIKPNGTLRWVQDLQRLNAVTVRDAGGLPNADALSESCAGRPMISLIDLYSGYDQFPVYPPDRPVTAMHTPRGLIHMNVAPQGWTNAVAMVQQTMIRAMHEKGRRPDVKKTDKIVEWPVPFHSITDVRSFRGTCGFWRAFVKNFAAKTEHLRKLVRQDEEWVWGEEQEEVVAKMKEEFREGGLVLGAPDYDATETRSFIVETDAGPTALGGVLIQADMEGKERPLRFESRTLCTTEKNYSQIKRETLAVLHCYPIWQAPNGYERRNELVLKPFEEEDPWGGKDVQWMMELALASSHSLVEDMSTIEEGPGQVERHEVLMGGMYLLVNTLLQESLDQSGSLNPAGNVNEVLESQDDEFEEGEIKEAFHAEEYDGIYLELGLLLSCEMRLRNASDRAQRMLRRYLVRDGHLFVRREAGNPRRVVCGRNRQIDVIVALHDGIAGGHRGIQATYAKISELYYWDGMMDMVGEDTPPQTPAVGLRLGDAPGSTQQAKERLQREEAPLPSSEKTPSPEGRAAVRREALTLIDRHLAAYALEHPDLEEPAPAESRQESCQPEKEMEAEIPRRVDLHTKERAPAGETAEEKRARRTRRIDEIWQERQRLEAAGELPEQQQEGQRSEAAGALPGQPLSAPARAPEILEIWRDFWEQRGEELPSPVRAGFGVARKAEERLDRKIKFLTKTTFDRHLLLEGDLAGKKMKEASHGVRLEAMKMEIQELRALVASQTAIIESLRQQTQERVDRPESSRQGEQRQPGQGLPGQPSAAEPRQEPPMGRAILEPEEARARRQAEREAFEFRAPTELATLPVAAADPVVPLTVEEGLPPSSSEPYQGSTEESMGVLLEAVHTMQEEVSLFLPEQRIEEPLEKEMGIKAEDAIESRLQKIGTPEYGPEEIEEQPTTAAHDSARRDTREEASEVGHA
ncbi:hypothetical protein CBR_g36257 [Chara braunii]|uniref:Reverse transcriptase/retrotransposon-derived protein RNase H-like domain-containing protein n=1 Tax=Chara braunii TaxID=69332 RepID=A0A388LK99_CHABU|nr:hypothetical protein CBR_g36257 [Chara braunii]|eukprot:GBG82729.1 hypothetical protein CBR_g36257 [Chara braunii]